MESSDGFRRRAAITITPQNQSRMSIDLQEATKTNEKYKINTPHKFQKINRANHAILKNRKKEH